MATQPSQAQAPVANGANGNSFVLTLGATPTAGNTIKAAIGGLSGTTTVSSIVQTNVTWTLQKQLADATRNKFLEIWTGVVAASPGAAATVNLSGSQLSAGLMVEYIGLASSDFDQTTTNSNAAGATLDTTSTPATTQPYEVEWSVFTVSAGGSGGVGWAFSSPTNGYVFQIFGQASRTSVGITTSVAVGLSEKIVSTTGTAGSAITPTDAYGDTTWPYIAVAATFIGASQPSTGSNLLTLGVG